MAVDRYKEDVLEAGSDIAADEDGSQSSEVETDEHRAYRNKSYRYFALGILTLVYTFNFVDRQIITILSEFIIADLGLSDAQYGALNGIAFAAIYCVLGIPVAVWADRGNRRSIIAMALTVWSAMTMLCGGAQNFAQLFAARFGVGAGEAGGSPPAHSMISDMFPVQERATALSIYSMGVYAGVLIGMVGGAYLVQFFSWRIAFVVVGAPGILLAIALRLFVKEPPRGMAENRGDAKKSSILDVFKLLKSRKAFVHLSIACALHAFVTYGLGGFMPLFLRRVHDMPLTDVGLIYGLMAGLGGMVGTFAGGYLSDRMANKTGDKNWYIWICIISTLAAIPFALVTFLVMPTGLTAALSYFVPVFFAGFYLAPCIALTHGMVGLRMRALSSAVLFFILNLIGLGIGPIATGLLSDYFEPQYGLDAIRYALAATALVNVWCAVHYYLASRSLKHALDNAPA